MLIFYKTISKKILHFISLSIFICVPSFVFAAETWLAPFFSLQESYDDNIYMYSSKKIDDFVTYVRPKITFYSKTERSAFTASQGINIIRYADRTELDTEEYQSKISFSYNFTEKLLSEFSADYIKDTTLESQWLETGLALERNTRKRYGAQSRFLYAITEKQSLDLSFFGTVVHSSSDVFYDYLYVGGSAQYSYNILLDRLSLRAICAYHYYETDLVFSRNVLNYLGMSYDFSPTLQMQALVGARYLNSEYSRTYFIQYGNLLFEVTERYDQNDWGFLANFELTKRLEKGSIELFLEKSIVPSIVGDVLSKKNVSLLTKRDLTERLSFGFRARYYAGKNSGSFKKYDYYSYSFRPVVRYRLTENLFMHLSYFYQYYKNKISSDTKTRNVFYFKLTWSENYFL